MIIEAYYCLLATALFFVAVSFVFPGKIIPPVIAGLIFAILSIASGEINVCGTAAPTICNYEEPALIYV